MSEPTVISYKVATTLTAKRIVALNGTAHTVAYPASSQLLPRGITIDDVQDTNQGIPVQVNGDADLEFIGSCTSGNLVTFDSSGYGKEFSPAQTSTGLTLPTGVIGVLVGPTVALTNTVAKVSIQPNLMR